VTTRIGINGFGRMGRLAGNTSAADERLLHHELPGADREGYSPDNPHQARCD
jgi:hypothetical protein